MGIYEKPKRDATFRLSVCRKTINDRFLFNAHWIAISERNRNQCSHQEMSELRKLQNFTLFLVCTAIVAQTNQILICQQPVIYRSSAS